MKTNSTPKKILLVDDDDTNNFICRKMLQIFDPNIQTIEFLDPVAALRYLQEEQCEDVSLVLLDINMPKMNGWQFLELLDKQTFHKDVIMLTSSSDPGDHQKAKRDGKVKDFWTKPLNLNMLSAYFSSVE